MATIKLTFLFRLNSAQKDKWFIKVLDNSGDLTTYIKQGIILLVLQLIIQ